jgi:Pyruvate/2-oxoacid:ferredoxin oxidoreductase delta subunit/flavodoxin
MSTQIYYFSGTGNSLHIARELAKQINNCEIIPIISALERKRIKSKADSVGFVFPINAFTLPPIVREFIGKIDLSSASYIFAIPARICFSSVFSAINKILRKQGKELALAHCIEMPQNYIIVFPVPGSDEIEKLESKMQEEVAKVAKKIHSRKIAGIKKDGPLLWMLNHILFSLVRLVYNVTNQFGMQKRFYADDRCTGCGICEQVCLSGTIVMEDSHPVWKQDTECLHCLACLHYCPNHAVQIRKSKTLIRGRYHHPEVSVKDIARQK